MEITLYVFLIALGSGLVTLIPRILPLMVLSKVRLPDWFLTWLSFVPVTVMTALLAESLFTQNNHLAFYANRFELIAIIPSILVAVIFRSLLGSVVIGVVCIALLRWFFG